MRRAGKIAGLALLVLALLPAAAVSVLLVGANSDAGRRLIERQLPVLTAGQVRLEGLSGHFPDHPRLARLELADQAGTYATVEDVALDWNPWRLFGRLADIDRLAVGRLSLDRLPASQQSASGGGLPVRVELRSLTVERIELGQPVLGQAASLSLAGSARLDSLELGQATLTAQRLDGGGSYSLTGRLEGERIDARLSVREPAQGLIASLAALPEIGPLAIDAALAGPRAAEQTSLTLTAGPLSAKAEGRLDLVGQAADLTVTAAAPAMAPRPDLAWRSVGLEAHVAGPFAGPAASGRLTVEDLQASGASLGRLTADLKGDAGQVELSARLDGLRLPGSAPDLLAAAPVAVTAKLALQAPARPVDFTLSHPLIRAEGHAETAGPLNGSANLSLDDLAPLARLGGVELAGRAGLAVTVREDGARIAATVTGTTTLTRAPGPAAALLGQDARIDLAGSLEGQNVTIERARIDGKAVRLAASGSEIDQRLDIGWSADLTDLALLAPAVAGRLSVQGRVRGPFDDLAVTASAKGEVATRGQPRQPIELTLDARGLPNAPTAEIGARGSLDGAPLRLAANLRRTPDGSLDVAIRQAGWKSAEAHGRIRLSSGKDPEGAIDLHMERLADLSPVIGQPLGGRVEGRVDVVRQGRQAVARIRLEGRKLAAAAGQVERLLLEGTVADPAGRPRLALRLSAEGVDAGQVKGSLTASAEGPAEAIALRLAAELKGGPLARVTASGRLDTVRKQLELSSLEARSAAETVRLAGPAHLSFANGMAVDRLRLAVRQSAVEIAGSLAPGLDLRVDGNVDLAVLDPILTPNGRSARGRLTVALSVTGSPDSPRLAGTVRLGDGEIQDYLAGLRLTGVTASLRADGDTVRIEQLVAHAGPGTISAEGSVGAFAPGLPVDLRVRASNAEPLATDLLTANLGADLTIQGQAEQQLDVAGTIHVNRASINVPEKFPQSVAVLDVRRPGQGPPPAAAAPPGSTVALALVIEAPEQVFVRGHGLDAEMGGTIRIGGTAAAPQIAGGLSLRHGTVSLAGQTLNFTKGTVGFNGSGVQQKLDPTLDLQAETTSGSVTATLAVTGYADSPRIKLTSSPELPQDEILAHLLFGQSTKQLSPLQIAQVAQGLASLTGVEGGFNPLSFARQKLGLDRLSTGAGSTGSGASVEAGKYVAKGVFVGAKQQTAGGTQAEVQVDLTEHFKLNGTVGTGGGAKAQGADITPQNDPGSSVGLSYRFEY